MQLSWTLHNASTAAVNGDTVSACRWKTLYRPRLGDSLAKKIYHAGEEFTRCDFATMRRAKYVQSALISVLCSWYIHEVRAYRGLYYR